MEQLHWARHRCRQLLASDVGRGWYSSPGGDALPAKGSLGGQGGSPQRLGGKRRTVVARHGPYRAEYRSVSKGCQGNSIRTTKYSLLSFIPMNLFQQFHRAANLYFLFLVLLNWVPVVEAFQKEITMIPLAVVLGVIAIKDALEDYRRYLFDKKVNNNIACVYSGLERMPVGRRTSKDHHHLGGRRPRRRTVASRCSSSSSSTAAGTTAKLLRSYAGNGIRTTKYSVLSFLPKNLFEQLHRAANVYFIFLAALNFVPVVEAFQPEVSVLPIAAVMTATAAKDLWEDWRRYASDRLVNRLPCEVYSSEQQCYVARRWQDVRVGDFVRLSCNEIIPADMLLLYSSDPHGVCYIETANLDGETNLKQRQVVPDLPQGTEVTPESFHSHVECENPNDDLSRFKGYMEHPNKVRVGLHINNLLLRSCTVRNTETVVGMVVYAGHETKAMKNNSGPRYKRSQLERRLNVDVLWCVVLLFFMCFAGAVGHGLWLKQWKDPIFLDGDEPPPALAGFYVFWTMIIVLQVLIPISLYVSIEIVKLGQIYFIQNDVDLYNEALDRRVQCRALNITEDLGRVQYLFSDKTGTLTENKMVFRRCTIYGVEYPHLDNARRLEVYEAEESESAQGRSPTLRSGCSVKSLSCRSLSCNRSSVSLHTLTNEDEEAGHDERGGDPASDPAHYQQQQQPGGAFCSRMAKEVIPDPLLVRKLNCLSSPPLLALSGGGSPWGVAPPPGSAVAPPTPVPVAPPSLELTYIVDFFMALAICNSVVVSSPSQPRHHVVQVSETRTPLKSLEDIKLMFQRFSPLTHFSSLSTLSSSTTAPPPANNESPHSFTRRLFPWGNNKAGSFSPAASAGTATPTPIATRGDPDPDPDPGPQPGELEVSILGSESTTAQVEKNDGTSDGGEDEGWRTEDDPPAAARGVDELSSGGAAADDTADEQLLYEAESPDEAALVHAARAYRCTLRARSTQRLLVDLPGMGSLAVQLLHVLPFDSSRKRMSVVVRHPLTGQVVVYTKGADSAIMELAEAPPQGREQAAETYAHIREQTQKHLDGYAREGLRTLCIAKKVMEEEEYEVWLKRHVFAETSIENREELLMESAQNLETNLTLLGATGIVDRLQEEVPETIEALQKAGVKVWVLTGDKQETAVNIACACRLLQPNDQLLTANCGSKDACAALLQQLIVEVERGRLKAREEEEEEEEGASPRRRRGVTVSTAAAAAAAPDGGPGFTLVMDGRTLAWALQEELKEAFLELSRRCKAVICCRSTPLQKSQVVRLVRDHLKVMTLAIGDGANDVSMIQVADVGIGISGQEGMQAVMSSDFAISRFKHLRKLLLVHGHWCYARLANMILYFFYKNVMYVNLLFWYQFFCGFSGSVMINAWVLILFNLLFTSVPPLVYGVLDRDVGAGALTARPRLYAAGSAHKVYEPSTFWLTILDAFYQSLVCFFVPYCAYAGSDVGVLAFGSPINTSALFIILLHQVIESRTLTWIHVSVLLGSAALYFAFVVVFSVCCVSCSPPTNPLGVETLQMTQPLFYLVCVLTTVIALLPRVVFRAVSNSVCPSPVTRAFLRERADPAAASYARRMRRWNQAHARGGGGGGAHPHRAGGRLPVHEDPHHHAQIEAGAGSVLS